jgi:hypothetical protein
VIREVRFKVGFDMATEYDVVGENWQTTRVKVRIGAHTCNSSGEYMPAVMQTIGTVMVETWGRPHTFPSPEIVAHFRASYGIPLVGARWSPTWGVEYDGPAPSAPIKVHPWRDGTEWTWLSAEWHAKCEAERAAREAA